MYVFILYLVVSRQFSFVIHSVYAIIVSTIPAKQHYRITWQQHAHRCTPPRPVPSRPVHVARRQHVTNATQRNANTYPRRFYLESASCSNLDRQTEMKPKPCACENIHLGAVSELQIKLINTQHKRLLKTRDEQFKNNNTFTRLNNNRPLP